MPLGVSTCWGGAGVSQSPVHPGQDSLNRLQCHLVLLTPQVSPQASRQDRRGRTRGREKEKITHSFFLLFEANSHCLQHSVFIFSPNLHLWLCVTTSQTSRSPYMSIYSFIYLFISEMILLASPSSVLMQLPRGNLGGLPMFTHCAQLDLNAVRFGPWC